jgi:hypothetical protein
MQAIARVNRLFGSKPGGLVVDYLGIADDLRNALLDYTEGDRNEIQLSMEQAVKLLQEKYEIVAAMFHGFDYSRFFTGTPPNASPSCQRPPTGFSAPNSRRTTVYSATSKPSPNSPKLLPSVSLKRK